MRPVRCLIQPVDLFVLMYVRREAVLSGQIEERGKGGEDPNGKGRRPEAGDLSRGEPREPLAT
jgi:hypothetical protein